MTQLQQAREWFREGDLLEQVENTLYDRFNGTIRRLDRVGKSFYDCTIVDGDGKPYRGNIPTRAGDILAINDHTITHKVGRDDHTITLRRVREPVA